MDVVAVAIKNIWDRRLNIQQGYRISWEAPIMRHFTVELEKVEH
jgi:tryptophanase